jgi:hypothetical protein
VLRVDGIRYGQPDVSSAFGESLSSAPDLLGVRDYAYLSVGVVERLDVPYVVDIQGKAYDRTQVRSSVGYERQVSVRRTGSVTTGYNHLMAEIVDFPLLHGDGAPAIPADASTITLELLALGASYEVSFGLRKDDSYLRDEPPITNPLRAVTMAGVAGPSPMPVGLARKSKLRLALEDVAKRAEYADWILDLSQLDPKVPVITISVQPGRSPYETKKALKALVMEGQKACEAGELLVILEENGRRFLQAQYHSRANSVTVTPVP